MLLAVGIVIVFVSCIGGFAVAGGNGQSDSCWRDHDHLWYWSWDSSSFKS